MWPLQICVLIFGEMAAGYQNSIRVHTEQAVKGSDRNVMPWPALSCMQH